MNWETQLAKDAPNKTIANKVIAAVRLLLTLDKHLLQVDASERSISHRLALHLTSQFPDLDVDCEYNRDHHETKRLSLPGPCARSANTDGSPVYPDIIVHRRGTEENVLVIEIKKSTSSSNDDNCDLEKLSAFRDELKYGAAIFLKLQCNESPTVYSSQWVIS
jgi:hypothetical protein